MLYKVRWRQEGDSEIEARDEEDAKDKVTELLNSTNLSYIHEHDTDFEGPELLSCEAVDDDD